MSDMRQALEEALFANPDDLASHMAYGDWLAEQGDPRGEFIQVQLALEDEGKPADERKTLQQREQELLASHESEWLGALAPSLLDRKNISRYLRQHGVVNRWRWARGWVEDLYLCALYLPTARALADCPATRLLRRLHVDYCGYVSDYQAEPGDGIPEGSEYPNLYPLARAPFLPHLRVFQLGESVDFENAEFEEGSGEGAYSSGAVAHGVVRLAAKMERVEELLLFAQAVRTDKLFALPNLTDLRVLVVYHNRMYPLEVLAANPALRNLAALRFHPAHNEEESCLPLAGVRALVHSPHLTSLKELHLRASDLGDEGGAEIVRSGILKRLEVLDLRFGRVTDVGARTLAECPDVRRLRRLVLEDNQLTDAGRSLLWGLGIDVRCDNQSPVGSEDYLYSGDME
jgi:uncharacterized protein (TIGR02996 family)